MILSQNQSMPPTPPPPLIPHHAKTASNASSIASKLTNNSYGSAADLPPKLPPQPQALQYQQLRNSLPSNQMPVTNDYETKQTSLPGYPGHLVKEFINYNL